MDGDYAWEKLHAAVGTLATGTGSLRSRLADAYVSSLMRLRAEQHFPWAGLRHRFEELMSELAPNGRFDFTLRSVPDEDLQRIAGDVVSLFVRLSYVVLHNVTEDESSEAWQARNNRTDD